MTKPLAAIGIIGTLFSLVPSVQAQTDMACTMQYQPVCGAQQVQCVKAPCYPIYKTYGNACVLNAEGATFLHEGECQVDESGSVVPEPGYIPPTGCTAWFDGCNQCGRDGEGHAYCTERACVGAPQPGYCTSYGSPQGSAMPPEIPVSSEDVRVATSTPPEPEARGFLTALWHSILSFFARF